MKQVVITIITLVLLSGCFTAGNDYKPPDIKTSETWHTPKHPQFDYTKEPLITWWSLFEDEILAFIVDATITENKDIKKALARIEEARANLSYALGGRFPTLEGNGVLTRSKQSESVNRTSRPITDYKSYLSLAWELDLFGRVKRSVEAATADYSAAQEDYYYVQLSASSEAARNYFFLKASQEQLENTLMNIEAQKDILEIVKSRYQSGLVPELEVLQAEEALAVYESKVPSIQNTIAKIKNNIALLTGKHLNRHLDEKLSQKSSISVPERIIPIGVPSELLKRRPDIRAAERRLAAETARLGIAEADLYPSLTLIGTIGLESVGVGDFMKASSSFYGFGPSFRWNIFDAGRIRSRIKAADARVEQALRNYELSILQALTEVENGLVDYVESSNKLKALEKSVAASSKVFESALSLYKSGLTNFRNVLEAQQNLLDQKNLLAQAKGDLAVSVVSIYKALGGDFSNQRRDSTELP